MSYNESVPRRKRNVKKERERRIEEFVARAELNEAAKRRKKTATKT
jgi:hypothetical protein